MRIMYFGEKILLHLIAALKSIYLHSKNVKYQSLPHFSGSWPKFAVQGKCCLGRSCYFRSFRTKTVLTVLPDGHLKIGDYAFINDGVNICAAKNVVVGDHSIIADLVFVYDTDFHQVTPNVPKGCEDVIIGRNIWIGAKAIILPGTVIGDHSVVAAGSIVTKQVPSRSIVGGTPARLIATFECPDDWIRS